MNAEQKKLHLYIISNRKLRLILTDRNIFSNEKSFYSYYQNSSCIKRWNKYNCDIFSQVYLKQLSDLSTSEYFFRTTLSSFVSCFVSWLSYRVEVYFLHGSCQDLRLDPPPLLSTSIQSWRAALLSVALSCLLQVDEPVQCKHRL